MTKRSRRGSARDEASQRGRLQGHAQRMVVPSITRWPNPHRPALDRLHPCIKLSPTAAAACAGTAGPARQVVHARSTRASRDPAKSARCCRCGRCRRAMVSPRFEDDRCFRQCGLPPKVRRNRNARGPAGAGAALRISRRLVEGGPGLPPDHAPLSRCLPSPSIS